uniref:DNA-directed RNA polymerase subunit alpha n=1 Tax=Hildenbrandia rivularis TaxID=135206 RepID=A0A1C9CFR0_9FLOR|nr:DNA-directed RNA polymerase alpha subunit [Hildenbrandia rivularis]AOM67223.1 DNA-directed RNA polymerase alpha subunit [Hildenbrandia rivularis]
MTQLQIEYLESNITKPRELYGKFSIKPLDYGQGITIGNALRRTLLSDLQGTSIVAVRISTVNHEFSTIPGVKEDVLEILLNLKTIILKNHSNKLHIGRIRLQGPAVITAGLFDLPTDIEVVDPCQYVATICNNNIFEMEFKIANGKGYQLINQEFNDSAVDFLPIDAIFMPVEKVWYHVEKNNNFSHKSKENLIFEIWTNGSILPHTAITQAASILNDLFYSLRNIQFQPTNTTKSLETKKITQVLIEELQLSVRAYNCLKRAQIHSIADLLDYSQEELLEIKNFGQKSAQEVINALQDRLGINLPKEKATKSQ